MVNIERPNQKARASNIKKTAIQFNVRMVYRAAMTMTDVNDVNARILAVASSVHRTLVVPLTFNLEDVRLPLNQFVDLVSSNEKKKCCASFNSRFNCLDNKPGECPQLGQHNPSDRCDRECYTDADCRGDSKCCVSGCGQVCVHPEQYADVTQGPPAEPERPVHYPGAAAPALEHKRHEDLDIVQSEGGLATLKCFATGYPQPTITWRYNSIVVS